MIIDKRLNWSEIFKKKDFVEKQSIKEF